MHCHGLLIDAYTSIPRSCASHRPGGPLRRCPMLLRRAAQPLAAFEDRQAFGRLVVITSLRHLFGFASTDTPTEPEVPARPCQRHYEGSQWQDEYSWLEDGGAAVQKVLRQERQYAEGWLRHCAPLANALHDEMLHLVPTSQISVPERVGGHEYFVQRLPGRPHPCYMRRPVAAAGVNGSSGSEGSSPAEVVLDLNELVAVHGEYVQVGQVKLSRCGQRVAFTLDAGGGEEAFGAFTRDLCTGAMRHLGALGGVVSLEWAADGRTLLCTQPNELGRPWRVVGCDAVSAVVSGSCGTAWDVYEEGDERFFVELGRTKDWSFLTINLNSKASSEVHLLPANFARPGAVVGAGAAVATLHLVQRRTPGLEYFVEHAGDQLYILSNARGADSYAVYRVPTGAPDLGLQHWLPVVAQPAGGGAIEDMDMLHGWLVLYLRRAGWQQVAALPLDQHGLPAGAAAAAAAGEPTGAAALEPAVAAAAVDEAPAAAVPVEELQVAPLPDWALSVTAGANADFHARRLRLLLSSPVHPEAAFDWDLAAQRLLARPQVGQQQQRRWRRQQVEQWHGVGASAAAASHAQQPPGQGAAEQQPAAKYAWRQLWAASADGTAVPLTVAHAAGLALPPAVPRPCLLVVYGAYGHCLPTGYLAERMPLLRRGWVLALAHVRGGGELGRRWHAAGRGGAKAASVEDLSACLDHLVATGYTAPGLLALEAHSAGGLTAGALLNRHPWAVGAALLEAPFVDVLSAMCRPELPLTVHEYEEWGDPRSSSQLEQIRALCPYQNVRRASYPPMLLTCSQQDLRVPFWGPLKYAARLRASTAAVTQQAQHSAHCSGPILLLPDGQVGHFVHERDLYETKAKQYAFLINALQGTL